MSELFYSFIGIFISLSGLNSQVPETAFIETANARAEVFKNSLPLAADRPVPTPIKKKTQSRGIETTAQSVLILDSRSGTVLFSKQPDQVQPIASLTKLMSTLVLHDLITDWQKKITFIKEDLQGGNKPNFFAGDTLTAEQFLYVGLIPSDNDAIAALVRSTGLSSEEFVAKMNEKALSFGMTSTTFADPTGLDPANKGTANDLSLLLREALKNERILKATVLSRYHVRTKSYPHLVYNTDLLLDSYLNRPPYKILAGKTGYIDESGYNLALSLRRGTGESETQIIAIVLGSKTNNERFQELKSLAAWAFENFDWPTAPQTGTAVQ